MGIGRITPMRLTKLIPVAIADSRFNIHVEYENVPWCCSGCGTQFEKNEDINHKVLSCGCSHEVCNTCLNLPVIPKFATHV